MVHDFFTLLLPIAPPTIEIAKSKGKLISIAFERKKEYQLLLLRIVGKAISLHRAIEERNKELIQKLKQRRLRRLSLKRAKLTIFIKIILYFGPILFPPTVD